MERRGLDSEGQAGQAFVRLGRGGARKDATFPSFMHFLFLCIHDPVTISRMSYSLHNTVCTHRPVLRPTRPIDKPIPPSHHLMALPPNQTLDKWKQAHNTSGGPVASTKQRRLQALLDEVDPSGTFRLDGEAEEIVLYLIEQFMTSVATHSAQLARHRGATAIEHSDVAFTLLKQWNMAVPAIGTSASRGGGGGGGGGKKGAKRKSR